MTKRHCYYVATILLGFIALLVVRHFVQPFGFTQRTFDKVRLGMSPDEVIELLGEPATDREGDELDGQRIVTFKCEGAVGMVAFRDNIALESTWVPNAGPPMSTAEMIWLWLWN